jgi:tuberous sclerosis protein 2
VIKSLSFERDWQVLKLILSKVPSVLQNKAILSRYGTALHAFVDPLIDLTKPNSIYPDCLTNIQTPRLLKSEFLHQVYPVLAAMAPYNEYLDSTTTRALINSLQNGLLSRECNRFCIVALTACALEMRKSMYAKIPEVLLNFTKISPTKQIATPMLEFLSTLIRLPDIFSSFTDTHYMYVFAIALPFTNPFKFDEYTVSLAHHVIVMWFLKCRLAYRQNFVQFIISGLNSNVLSKFEEGGFRKGSVTMTGKTSQAAIAAKRAADKLKNFPQMLEQKNLPGGRPRAASFTDTPVKSKINPVRDRHPTGGGVLGNFNTFEESMDKMMTFHQELSETCVDLLARYMFANASVKPKRLPTTDFLLKGGQSASWIVGTMIITVTTSICDQTSSRGDLCDRCYLICRTTPKPGDRSSQSFQTSDGCDNSQNRHGDELTSVTNAEGMQNFDEDSFARRRHASAFVGSSPIKSDNFKSNETWDLRKSSNAGLGSIMGRRVSISDEILVPVDVIGRKEKLHVSSTKDVDESICELEKLMNKQKETTKKKPELCACWCSGWAEVHVRRPSGDVSWMCRIQNPSLSSESHGDIPLTDLTALFHPSMEPQETGDFCADNPKPIDTKSVPLEEQKPSKELEEDDTDICVTDTPSNDTSKVGTCDLNVQLKEDETKNTSETNIDIGSNTSQPHSNTISNDTHPTSPLRKNSPNSKLLQLEKGSDQEVVKIGGANQRQLCGPIIEEEDRSFSEKRRVSSTQHPKLDATKSESLGSSRRQSAVPKEIEGLRDKVVKEQVSIRDRAHTISGPSPRKMPLSRQLGANLGQVQNKQGAIGSGSLISEHKAERVTGISPQFVFLTLYHSYGFGRMQNPTAMLDHEDVQSETRKQNDAPLLVPNSEGIKMAIKSLDRIHAHETHKVGVIYVGPGQADDEQMILSNEFGSLRYADFLHGLGTLISLRDIDKSFTFLGGLSAEDGDGEFSYMWEDDVMQVT